MQVTVELDPEVYSLASAYADAHSLSIGAAIGELVRSSERRASVPAEFSRLRRNEYGLLVVTDTGEVITSEMVKQLSEDPIDELSS